MAEIELNVMIAQCLNRPINKMKPCAVRWPLGTQPRSVQRQDRLAVHYP